LYTCGQSVVIRNIKNPLIAETYDEHQRAPTVARYSPSGYYIASGDASGTVRIWDTTQAEHPLKIELPVLGGAILDLAWSEDSKRIVVGGDGRDKYGHAFIWDSGASVGEIGGHAKPIYSIDMKPSRPYRVATGSEDMALNFYAGPPFKYQHAMTVCYYVLVVSYCALFTNLIHYIFLFQDHTRFVNCVRFSPNGNTLASVGSDKKIFLYDGKEGAKKGELAGDSPHTGGIYACSWSADSSKLLTSSGDCSAKIWDVESGACVRYAQSSLFLILFGYILTYDSH
jgi:WD40 repeat protein